jgi:hypothetical protein
MIEEGGTERYLKPRLHWQTFLPKTAAILLRFCCDFAAIFCDFVNPYLLRPPWALGKPHPLYFLVLPSCL